MLGEQNDFKGNQMIQHIYKEWGIHFTKIHCYTKAIDAFKKSIEKEEANDLRTHLGLCNALLKNSQYVEANEIAKKCIEIDPNNCSSKWMMAEALYSTGEFNDSLIHCYNSGHQRRYPFEDAIYRSNGAIQDCLGYNAPPDVLVILLPWLKKLEAYQNTLMAKLSEEGDEFQVADEENSMFQANDENYQHECYLEKFKELLSQKYLKLLAKDKLYLENLLQTRGLRSVSKANNEKLHEMIDDCLNKFNKLIDINREGKPLYLDSFKNRIDPITVRSRKAQNKEIRKFNITNEANSLITRLYEARMDGNYLHFFMYVDRAKTKFDSYPKHMFPMKKKCLNEIYKMVAKVYLDTRNVTRIKDKNMKQIHLKHHLGLRQNVIPRDEDLSWITSYDPMKRKIILKTFRQRLALANEPLELAWLYHEFSKFHIAINRYDLARYYAKKCRDAALKSGDDRWVLNAYHLLIRIELKLSSNNEAKDVALIAYLIAKKIGLDYLIDFYKQIILLLKNINIDKMKRKFSSIKREQDIMNLMTDKYKRDMNVLLQRFNRIENNKRQLSIKSHSKPFDNNFDMPGRSINPTSISAIESKLNLLWSRDSSRGIAGWMDFQDYQ